MRLATFMKLHETDINMLNIKMGCLKIQMATENSKSSLREESQVKIAVFLSRISP